MPATWPIGGRVADDSLERMVTDAKARALAARAAEEAQERAERARRVEVDRHHAEALLTRARPPLEELARVFNQQLEGEWQVEWHAPEGGGFGLRLGSAAHPAELRVEIDRAGQATLLSRIDSYSEHRISVGLDGLEAGLQQALPAWVEGVMGAPATRFRA